jgi:DNA-binding NarL/FixJ family response regulator
MAKILIADDHPLFREALRQVLTTAFDGGKDPWRAVEVGDFKQADAAIADDDSFDLVLLDLWMPGVNGFSGLIALRDKAPATPIIVISSSSDRETVRQIMKFGAMGFIPKTAPMPVMAQAIRTVLAGRTYWPPEATSETAAAPGERIKPDMIAALTDRQLTVLHLLVDGKPNKQIAYELGISPITVKAHVTAILRKLGVQSRAQAIVMARKLQSKEAGGR